jgi:hypothetical protein
MSFVNTQQAYAKAVGTTTTSSIWLDVRDPTSRDVNFNIGQFWLNKNSSALFYLTGFSSLTGYVEASWVIINVLQTLLETLSDTNNIPVTPSNTVAAVPNNIQLICLDGSLNVVSNPSNNRIEFSTANVSLIWQVITASPTTTPDRGYFTNGGGIITLALPSTSSVGDTFEVCTLNAAGWRITQAGSQQMRVGTSLTTSGASGYISSLNTGDWVELVCYQASNLGNDNAFMVNVKQGNITVF